MNAGAAAGSRGHEARRVLRGSLWVTVLRGTKLADRELFGKQDPYVVCSLLDEAGPCSASRGRVAKGGFPGPVNLSRGAYRVAMQPCLFCFGHRRGVRQR